MRSSNVEKATNTSKGESEKDPGQAQVDRNRKLFPDTLSEDSDLY